MKTEFDVIVLGYGPVGAVLANLLGRDGLSVAVIDRMLGIFDKPRAINIDHEVMRILQSVGLADIVDPITTHHTGTDFRGLDDRLIKVFNPIAPPYLLGWAPNLMFIQPEFEPILRGGVERFPNVEIFLGMEAVEVAQDGLGVYVTLCGEAPAPQRISGRYLVACDGAASPTRKRLGIGQDSLDFDEWWTVVDAWLKDGADVPRRTTQFCRPSGPTTYVVGPRGLRRWELKLLPGERPADYEDMAVVERRLRPFVDPDKIEIWRVATYRFHALVADVWRSGRVLLAGDAAHQMPPFMAQGLCSGIRDAGNLAWKLTAVLRDSVHEQLLDSYATERKPHIRELVATTKELGLIIGELNMEKARERDDVLGRQVETGLSETVRQKLIPDLTAGLIATNAEDRAELPAGALSPQPTVTTADGSSKLLDDLVGSRFLLLTLGAEPQTWLSVEGAVAWDEIGGKRVVVAADDDAADMSLTTVSECGSLFRDWMNSFGWKALLVRPDKYVFGAASDPETLNRYVRQIIDPMTPIRRSIAPAAQIEVSA